MVSSFKKWRDLTLLLLASTAYEALPIVSYVNIILSDVMESGFLIATLLFIRRIMRVIFDIPLGKIADRYGMKIIVYLAIIFKLIYLVFLALQTKTTLILAVIFDGFAISCFRGKINVLQYSTLKNHGMEKFYIKYQSIYNILLYALTFSMGMIANIIFIKYRYGALILISLIVVAITLLCFMALPSSNWEVNKHPQHRGQTNQGNVTLLGIVKFPPRLFILIVLIGICSLGWQLNAINQFLAIKVYPDKVFSSNVFNYGIIAMFGGSLISFIEPIKNIYILTIIYFVINAILTISPLFFINNTYLCYMIFLYMLFFVHYENRLRQVIIEESDQSSTYTILSYATSLTAAASIILSYVFHLIGQYINYYLGYSVVFAILTTITFIALFVLHFSDKQGMTRY